MEPKIIMSEPQYGGRTHLDGVSDHLRELISRREGSRHVIQARGSKNLTHRRRHVGGTTNDG